MAVFQGKVAVGLGGREQQRLLATPCVVVVGVVGRKVWAEPLRFCVTGPDHQGLATGRAAKGDWPTAAL